MQFVISPIFIRSIIGNYFIAFVYNWIKIMTRKIILITIEQLKWKPKWLWFQLKRSHNTSMQLAMVNQRKRSSISLRLSPFGLFSTAATDFRSSFFISISISFGGSALSSPPEKATAMAQQKLSSYVFILEQKGVRKNWYHLKLWGKTTLNKNELFCAQIVNLALFKVTIQNFSWILRQ